MILERIVVGQMEVNCYILADEELFKAIIIDPGEDEDKIRRFLESRRLEPAFIINTHGHYDHIGCDDKFGVPVYVHQKDAELLRNPELNLSTFLMSSYSVKAQIRTLKDAEKIELGKIELEVIHTPGHTPGGICLLMKKPKRNILFTGDSLFSGGIGRTDFPGASQSLLVESVKKKLLKLPDETVIYPGHGPDSTIGREKSGNPFLMNPH